MNVHMQGDPSQIIPVLIGMVLCFIISAVPIMTVIIALVRHFKRQAKNDADMMKKAAEIKSKQLEIEENKSIPKRIVKCPFCGRANRYDTGSCKYCGGVLNLKE